MSALLTYGAELTFGERVVRKRRDRFYADLFAKAAAGEATDSGEDEIIHAHFKRAVAKAAGAYVPAKMQMLFEAGVAWPQSEAAGDTPSERIVYFRLICNQLISSRCGSHIGGPALERILDREPTARAYVGDKSYASLARLVLNYPSFVDNLRSDTGLPVDNLDEAARRTIEHDRGI